MLISPSHGKSPSYETAALRCGLPRRSPAAGQRKPLHASRASNIDPKRLYSWQKAAQPPLPTDPTEAAEVRALRAANKRQAQELEILKKAIAIFSQTETP